MNRLIQIKNAAPVFDASVWIVAILFVAAAAPIARGAEIISNGPVSFVKGSDAIHPRPGDQGSGPDYNSLFYVLPGMGDAENCPTPENCHHDQHAPPNQPFFIAYEPTAPSVQSSDWWSGVGLQWYVAGQPDFGWASGYANGVILSQAFISEPFYYQFVDFDGRTGTTSTVCVYGTRMPSRSRPTVLYQPQHLRHRAAQHPPQPLRGSMLETTSLIALTSIRRRKQW